MLQFSALTRIEIDRQFIISRVGKAKKEDLIASPMLLADNYNFYSVHQPFLGLKNRSYLRIFCVDRQID